MNDDSAAQHCRSFAKEGCHVHKISPQHLLKRLCSASCGLERPYVDHDGSKHCMLDAAALSSSSDGRQEVFQARELKNEYFNDVQSHRGRLLDA